jgi:hypothetical protein
MAGDLLASISAEIAARMAELRPALAEYERLLSAAEALGRDEGRPTPKLSVSRSPRASAAEESRAKAPKRTAAAASPAPPVRRGSGRRGSAAGTIVRAGSSAARASSVDGAKAARAVRGAAQQAILAALEHGSHTVGELTVVTAMSGQNIRENLRRMLGSGTVTRAKREGKAAYALAAGGGGG